MQRRYVCTALLLVRTQAIISLDDLLPKLQSTRATPLSLEYLRKIENGKKKFPKGLFSLWCKLLPGGKKRILQIASGLSQLQGTKHDGLEITTRDLLSALTSLREEFE